MTAEEIKEVVREVLAEQKQEPEVDRVVLKTIATLLTSFGIEESDRVELKADLVHLRKWRKSVDQATTVTFGVMVTTLVTGVLAALWVGIKAMIGK